MKVFMLGWEFPPFISGGLGTACYGLTKALDGAGVEVIFVLPKIVSSLYAKHVKLLSPSSLSETAVKGMANYMTGGYTTDGYTTDSTTVGYKELKNVKFKEVNALLEPYGRPENYQTKIEELIRQKQEMFSQVSHEGHVCPAESHLGSCDTVDRSGAANMDYAGDMYSEIHRYAAISAHLAMQEDFDVIHAHDWMTFPAGIAASAATGKPLVVQVHSTEFDRSGENVNQRIYDVERRGMHAADKIIAVSHLTRNIIISRYGVPGEKVEVVHNGVERNKIHNTPVDDERVKKDEKLVLFLGRITMQKGPEYFLHAAKKVLEVREDVKFVMAGSGDMIHDMVELAAELGIGHKVLFTGFLRGAEVDKVYRMADLYVMPSVSEPFGIAPLEALNNDVPVIISKQSGVSEVLQHVLKVDFWDVREMANKMLAVLKYKPLEITLRNHGNFEVRKLRWEDSAEKCNKVYCEMAVSS